MFLAREKVPHDEWIALHFDDLGAHFTSEVMELFYNSRIAVFAQPAHTSDQVQPLDVSVSPYFKRCSNMRVHMMLTNPNSLAHA